MAEPNAATPPLTLKELLDTASGRNAPMPHGSEVAAGIADHTPYPFFGIIGQREMKLALLLNLVNPSIGGVLLVGPRGTGKTTAVRSLRDLLPYEARSLCYYGCTEQDVESGGMEAVCPACAKKYGQGEPLTAADKVRLVELPLNATIEDVLGGKAAEEDHERYKTRRGLLSQADRNILYIDEVNLLPQEIIDSILDAAAQGFYNLRRGFQAATFNARFVLVGSMNPEEGNLRPQILDRFGLRVFVRGLQKADERLMAYDASQAYTRDPRQFVRQMLPATLAAQAEIASARTRLASVQLPRPLAEHGIETIRKLGIDSLRAEISWFEAARALAAADDRNEVTAADLREVAPMSLRLRRSIFMTGYFSQQGAEEQELAAALN